MRHQIASGQSDTGVSVSVPGLPECWSQGAMEARWAGLFCRPAAEGER